MSLIRYQPWSNLNNWPGDVFDLFNAVVPANADARSQATWQPRVDVVEYEDRYELRAELAGVDPASVDITLEDGQLTLAGERAAPAPDEQVQYQRLERQSGRFVRRFTLPDSADADNINARSEHGVVHISIPKRAKAQAVKINVAA